DPDYYQPRAVAGFIDKAKNEGQNPDEFARMPMSRFDEKIPQIYRAYQEELLRNNAFDFGDLLLQTLHLFQTAPDVLEQYQTNLKYVMVDEYQDTNKAQYLLVRALTAKHKNLCV